VGDNSRASEMTPAAMLTALEDPLKFLVDQRRSDADPHRSMRAAIDDSYQLLSPELQGFLHRVSQLQGAWSLENAQDGLLAPSASDLQSVDWMEQLHDHSMLLSEERPELQFRMLEVLRRFASSR